MENTNKNIDPWLAFIDAIECSRSDSIAGIASVEAVIEARWTTVADESPCDQVRERKEVVADVA